MIEAANITPVHGKTAFLTGASRGIGAGIARALASDGYSLGLCCEKNLDRLEALKHELTQGYGVTVESYMFDVSDPTAVSMAASDFLEKFGHIDVLINNAGISVVGLLDDLDDVSWNRILSVNLSSAFYSYKAFSRAFLQQKSGDIINISSMWGSVGASCEAAYSASKGGLNALTRSLGKELAPSGIRVNAISCGIIDTDMNREHFTEEDLMALKEDVPMGRLGNPADVGQAVLSILHGSSYLTAQVIELDGGYI
ncbi:SDR family NAD(P)-dependent oxidoreductase [Lachnospiraceae bacterium YH-ros2226]|nr:SDR family NAD(P)-dependent oxidoreductase [Lachnospiraceae bacterium]MDD6448561.1 SDR family NAD(P)-dependent oxidoreductase [Lachnospiraceae bacterium]